MERSPATLSSIVEPELQPLLPLFRFGKERNDEIRITEFESVQGVLQADCFKNHLIGFAVAVLAMYNVLCSNTFIDCIGFIGRDSSLSSNDIDGNVILITFMRKNFRIIRKRGKREKYLGL